jgi:protein phosphatase
LREDLPVTHYTRSDVGVKRSHNQDAFGVGVASSKEVWRARGHLFVVADGMGAHAVGELASKIAVDTIRLSYSKSRGVTLDEALRRSIVDANHEIHNRGQQNREFAGMGTTATALVLGPDGARVGHVGDSRCYRIRGEAVEQLSFDHSLVWEMARRQNIPPEDLKTVPKNIIVRSLGPEAEVNVDVNGPYKTRDGDRFLLCTDGLSGQVSDREIWSVVSYLPPEEACAFLIDLANFRGGVDNVTLILVQVGDPARPTPRRFSPLRWARRTVNRFLERVPMRYVLLALGSGLCGAAAAMKNSALAGSLPVAVAGVAVLLSAIGWFAWVSYQRRKGLPMSAPPPPIYRSQQCVLQPSMIEKLAKNEAFLREAAVEHEWKVAWEGIGQHRADGEKAFAAGDLATAFREYCRALALLFAGMREARNKQEVFDPHWQTDSV